MARLASFTTESLDPRIIVECLPKLSTNVEEETEVNIDSSEPE